jgi:hypothetical protein
MVLYAFIYAYQTNCSRTHFNYVIIPSASNVLNLAVCGHRGRKQFHFLKKKALFVLMSRPLQSPCPNRNLTMLLAYILIIWQGPPQQPLMFRGLHSLLLLSNKRHLCRRASHSVLDHLPTRKWNNRKWTVMSHRNMAA